MFYFQVRLIYKDEEENIPNFDDIFRDDEEEVSILFTEITHALV